MLIIESTKVLPDEQILATMEYYNRLSLYINRETAVCARLSCGGVIETCRAVAEGQCKNAFAIVRPPGHHAEPEQEMGFCFFNNVAVAAQHLIHMYRDKGIKKVLILDWYALPLRFFECSFIATIRDVHHGKALEFNFYLCRSHYILVPKGNGTQKAFWTDPNVLYISIHQFQNGSFYPGGMGGAANQVGHGSGTGSWVHYLIVSSKI